MAGIAGILLVGAQAIRSLVGGKTSASFGALEVTVTISTEHVDNYVVTKKPVETGAKITDQHLPDPQVISISGIIGDGRLSFAGFGDTYKKKEAILQKIADSGEPFTLITELKTYENVVFENKKIARTLQQSGALFFDATLCSIKIIETKTEKGGTDAEAKKNPGKGKGDGKGKAENTTRTGGQKNSGRVEPQKIPEKEGSILANNLPNVFK